MAKAEKSTKVWLGKTGRHYHTSAECSGLLRGGGEVIASKVEGVAEPNVISSFKVGDKEVELTLCARCNARMVREADAKVAA